MSHSKLGDVQLAQGDLAGALASFRKSLEIIERLARQDPTNAAWQRDLSVSHNKLGDVQLAQGDLAGRWPPSAKTWKSPSVWRGRTRPTPSGRRTWSSV